MSETDDAGSGRANWLDRRRDLAGWVLTPLVTLVVTPVLAGCTAMVTVLGADQPPALCEAVRSENGCEEATLTVLGAHLAVAAGMWLLLWLVPWWRGLRVPRVLLAVAVAGVVIAVPLRLAG
ncbi:hypothetical protein [Micromonospora sp. NPDC005291]|uniref:hypothetical protein n=1 Tax=Micromonospora sp. NPDC005291 TaxID=3156872 RepID=UPI0033B04CAB